MNIRYAHVSPTEEGHGETRQDGLRMKELMEATGLPKSTILYYVAQGLLPEPVRTGRNMAYYDAASVERAKLIKKVQGTYCVSLGKDQVSAGVDGRREGHHPSSGIG